MEPTPPAFPPPLRESTAKAKPKPEQPAGAPPLRLVVEALKRKTEEVQEHQVNHANIVEAIEHILEGPTAEHIMELVEANNMSIQLLCEVNELLVRLLCESCGGPGATGPLWATLPDEAPL